MSKMLDEIKESGKAVLETVSLSRDSASKAAGTLAGSDYVIITGSGSSYHAGMPLQITLMKREIPAVCVKAPDFSSYIPERFTKNVTVVVMSQSGESADAVNAHAMAKKAGARTVAITNEKGSTLSSSADVSVVTAAGHEEAVAATKSYIAQLTAVSLIQGYIEGKDAESELNAISEWIQITANGSESLEPTAKDIGSKAVFLGNGYLFSTASEGALKFQETGNMVTEAYPAREYLHGPIQNLDSDTTVFILKSPDEDITDVMEEVKKYTRNIITVGPRDSNAITVPESRDSFRPVAYALPLQILANYKSLELGLNPDNPDKLTKVVK